MSRGAFGVLESVFERGGVCEVDIRVASPLDLAAKLVRVVGIPGHPSAPVGDRFNVLGTDVMGDATVQRARWSTVYWPPMPTSRGCLNQPAKPIASPDR